MSSIVEGERNCSNCGVSETQSVLLTIILPPIITKRQDLCPECVKIAIDDSKKLGKATQ